MHSEKQVSRFIDPKDRVVPDGTVDQHPQPKKDERFKLGIFSVLG